MAYAVSVTAYVPTLMPLYTTQLTKVEKLTENQLLRASVQIRNTEFRVNTPHLL